jgi:prevent-host-death family protein
MAMTITVNVHEAKTHFSRLLEQAHAGQEIILAKAGKPYARLVPLEPAKKAQRVPGRLKGLIEVGDEFFEPLPEDELSLWENGPVFPAAH